MPTVVLGIDPGTRRIGYGAVVCDGGNLRHLASGLITPKSADVTAALLEIKRGVGAVIKKFKPDLLALETLYFTKNQKTAIAVAEARGVIRLAAAELRLPICELGPGEVKMGITGYGSADKRAVSKMVKIILNVPCFKAVDDVTDALAIAIVASNHARLGAHR